MKKAYLKMMVGVSISGSLGVFVRNIPLSNGEIMAYRTLLGGLFLLGIYLIQGGQLPLKDLRDNLGKLIISGCLFGISGLLLFNSYDQVGVGLSSIVYSLNPVFIFIISILVLGESPSLEKTLGLSISVLGLVLVNGLDGFSLDPKLIYGLLAALSYGLMAIINKKIRNLDSMIITIVQLLCASGLVFTYLLLKGGLGPRLALGSGLAYLLIIGLVHTGYAMKLYYQGIQELPGQSVALISYMESLSALVCSSLILGESLSRSQALGAVFILGGALMGELAQGRRTRLERLESNVRD